jgi:hypothetical protein
MPGCFAPGEAEVVAEFLGIDFAAFRDQFLTIGVWDDASRTIYYWRPRALQEPMLTDGWSEAIPGRRGPCVFLKEGRCTIHAIKPSECLGLVCAGSRIENELLSREAIVQKWEAAGNPLRGVHDKL